MPEPEALNEQRYRVLRPRLDELEKLKQAIPAGQLRLLSWSDRDRQRAEAYRRRAADLEYRYDLGLVSRNQWQAARRQAQLWE